MLFTPTRRGQRFCDRQRCRPGRGGSAYAKPKPDSFDDDLPEELDDRYPDRDELAKHQEDLEAVWREHGLSLDDLRRQPFYRGGFSGPQAVRIVSRFRTV